jgi:hypothetical protein
MKFWRQYVAGVILCATFPKQLREAFPFEQIPRYLLRDCDGIFGIEFRREVKTVGIKKSFRPRAVPTSLWNG